MTSLPKRTRQVRIGMYAHKTRLTPASIVVPNASIVATPVVGKRVVPIRRACGQYVDYYVPATAG